MALLIYYSHNHKCFRTKWGHTIKNNIGQVNGFDEEIYQMIDFYPKKETMKEKVIKALKKVIYRLETPYQKKKVVYIEKTRYPWWKR